MIFIVSFMSQRTCAQETSSFTDERDGKVYKTVKIGDQIWMAENLAYDAGKGCYIKNDDIYYKWETAKAACPDGWYLPTNDEWEQLLEYINDQKGPYTKFIKFKRDGQWNDISKHLKTTSNWVLSGKDYGGTDDYGFSAIPYGCYDTNIIIYGEVTSGFINYGVSCVWWTATEDGHNLALKKSLYYSRNTVETSGDYIGKGFNVRCVKD